MATIGAGLEFLGKKVAVDVGVEASGVMLVDQDDLNDDLVSDEEEDEVGDLYEMEHPLVNSIVSWIHLFGQIDRMSYQIVQFQVANNIMSYLTLTDLKTSRLVCRSWSEESRVHQARTVKVVIQSEDKLNNYIYEFIGDRAFFDTIQLGPYM